MGEIERRRQLKTLRYYCFTVLLLFAPWAQAQEVPGVIAFAALSPILMVLLAGVLGWVDRSPMSGLLHIGLILLWIVAFAALSWEVTTDWLIWTPIVIYSIHSLYILFRLVQSVRNRLSS